MGEVFLALTPEGREVAVKILRSPEKANLRSFEQEARLLTRLRHPAIARVEGFLTDSKKIFGANRGPCFWMELVAGAGVLDAARNCGAEQILGWLKSALEALQALQAQSISHGDLSPTNLLVTPGGQIKLIDFGMAGEFSVPPPKSAGTLPYLAPERIHGKNFPSSEIFSLGVIFYQALAGKHPRAESRSLAEMLSRKARPLLEAAPELAKGFAVPARVIDRMVELDPSRRFANAEEVLQALRGIETKVEAPVSASYYPVRMFGAETAWEKAQAALRTAASSPAWLWIHGPSGVGKRRFLRELAFQGALEGISFAEVSLAQLSRKMSEAGSGVRAFVVPGLEKLPTDALQPLLRLKREGLPPKCLLVLEWNDDFLPDSSRRLLELLRAIPEALEISLGHLSLEDTRRLSVEALGEVPAAAAHRALYESTGGHPQLLLELVDLLRKQGVTEKRHFSREWLEDLVRFHSFEELLLFRLRELPAEERKILTYLATAEAPQGLETLAAALNPASPDGEGRPGLRRWLERLCERNLLRHDPTVDLYSLFLPALRQALLAALTESELESIHRNWLSSLPALPEQSAARLHHALALRDKKLVASLALAGVEAKIAAGLKSEALVIAGQALPFLENPANRSRLLRLQANLLIEADRYAEALEAAEAAFGLAADDEPLALKKAKYYLTTGILQQNLGRDAEAKERFARCLDLVGPEAGPELQSYRVRAQALLGMQELRDGRPEKALQHFREGLASPASQGTRAAELRRNLAAALAQLGDWAGGRDSLSQARRLYREAAYPAGEFAAWLQEGNLALDQDDPELAACCYHEAEGLARELRDELFLARVWNNLGVLARRRMDLGSALPWFNQALEILRTLGNPSDLAESLEQASRAEAAAGRFARAEELIQELRRSIPSFGAAQAKAERAEVFLNGVRSGHWAQPAVDRVWDLEARLQIMAMQKNFDDLKNQLLAIEAKLPPLIQVTFAERHDYRRHITGESGASRIAQSKRNAPMEILENL
ncbi:MAG TPA: serine/threonine-protein kinase, partial [bacterium]|nr:serine/threonine-protein kinase [bacterium]